MTELICFFSNPRFPPELIDAIFSFLDDFDEGSATLKRCSTDPVLLQFAEKYFYSTITVHGSYPGDFDADVLVELFSEKPHIALYVRNMKIILACSPKPCLNDILSMFLRLDSITLSIEESVREPWASWPESFRAAFVACVKSSPTMKKVVLENHLEFPLSVLDDCNIRDLIFRNVRLCIELPSTPLHDVDHTPLLDSLTLDGVRLGIYGPQFEVWATSHLRTLRSLTFSLFPDSSWFPLYSNTLTSLQIDFLRTYWTYYDINSGTITPTTDCSLSLFTLPHLQQLTISGDIVMYHKRIFAYNYLCLENYSPLPTICQVLATSPPSLAHLTLHLRIRFRAECSASILSTIDWQPLVRLLDSSTLSVQRTHLHVFVDKGYHFPIRIYPDQIIPTLCKSMGISRLIEQGVLVIHPSI